MIGIVLEERRAVTLAAGAWLALIYSAAACGLDPRGAAASAGFAAGGAGTGSGPATSASGNGGSLTISSSGNVTSGTAGGDGGAGGNGAGGSGAGGEGGAFVCQGEGLFEDPASNHCYWYVSAEEKGWLNAEAACKLWGPGGHLAAISSAPEYDAIVLELGPMLDMWLGGRNFAMDDVNDYVWSNGEIWRFAPDGNLPANEDGKPCIKLKDLAFQPKKCAETHKYLCERY